MAPWEAIIEKVPEGCRTLLAAAAALAMTMMATMLALTADAHVLALVDDLLRENVQRLDLLGRQGRQDAIGYLGLRGEVLARPQLPHVLNNNTLISQCSSIAGLILV